SCAALGLTGPFLGVGWAQGAVRSLQSCCCPELLPRDAGLLGALPQQDPAPHPGHSAWPRGLIKRGGKKGQEVFCLQNVNLFQTESLLLDTFPSLPE
ncbi:hypothetical protein CIB84_003975, partial [Bambusicola thoracicus]